ncbi:hypothetical protein ZWY2020_013013 [Hordeum vulgare]|nr:hypothetical protein ZWY2020_013013 [Hordeum vulgare]
MRAKILAALLAACLTHVALAAAPRRSLTVDAFPSDPLLDPGLCWESITTLCTCKHDLLASFFTGSPVPRPCCEAAGEVDVFCDPVTSSIVAVLLPRRLQKECDVINRHPSVRAPPRVPSVSVPSFFIRKLITQLFSFVNIQLFNR